MHTVVAGDNLWDLARAYLGSGDRWHQIYALNRGRPQPGGGTLTDPARIYPGWELLIPAAGPHPRHGGGNPHGGRPCPAPPRAGTRRDRLTRPGPDPAPAARHPRSRPAGRTAACPPGGVRLPSGALIGLGTAVVVSAAVAVARLRRRRRYRPGPVLTSSLEPAAPPPPVISALDRAARGPGAGTALPDGTSPDDAGPDLDLYEPCEQPFPSSREAGRAAPPAARLISRQPPGRQATAPPGPVPIGIRDGQEITADPAALGGLGLTGPGAPAAARAILAGLLARPPRGPDGTPARDHHPRRRRRPAPPRPRRAAGPPAHPRRPGAACAGRGARRGRSHDRPARPDRTTATTARRPAAVVLAAAPAPQPASGWPASPPPAAISASPSSCSATGRTAPPATSPPAA